MADEYALIRWRWSPQWIPAEPRWQQAMADVHQLLADINHLRGVLSALVEAAEARSEVGYPTDLESKMDASHRREVVARFVDSIAAARQELDRA